MYYPNENGFSEDKHYQMRATGYKLVKRNLISPDFSSVATAFETSLRFYSKYKRCRGKDGSYAYWIRHEVSTDELWDCGLVIIRQLHATPIELKRKLRLDELSKDDLRKWTEVDFVESTNIEEEAIFLGDSISIEEEKRLNLLNISLDTVKTHRRSIRRKLGIYGKKVNLRTKLLSLTK